MTSAEWCFCTEKLIPAGVMAIWADGKFHAPDSPCRVTDDLDLVPTLLGRMTAIRAEVAR